MIPEQLPLRDIHLPDPVSWWPPAPGWWSLAVITLILIAVLWLIRRILKRRRLTRSALDSLELICENYRRNGKRQQLAQSLSILLRRISLTTSPRRQVAALTGEAWLEFLEQGLANRNNGSPFVTGVGRALIEAPYDPGAQVDADALIALSRRWILVTTRQGRVK